jgi:hypothetical protein
VQGTVLAAGQHVTKVLEQTDESRVVMIFDRDEKHLMATVIGLPAYRVQTTDDTSFTFYEKSADQPAALRTWFYPPSPPVSMPAPVEESQVLSNK